MIRLILVLAILIGFLIFSYPFLVAQVSLGKKDPHARDLETIKMVRSVFGLLLKLAGVTVTVKGAENIPEDKAVLYVGNHRSYFDILAGYSGYPLCTRWKGKSALRFSLSIGFYRSTDTQTVCGWSFFIFDGA